MTFFQHAGLRPLWPVVLFLPWLFVGFAYLVTAMLQGKKESGALSAPVSKSSRREAGMGLASPKAGSGSNRVRVYHLRSAVSAASRSAFVRAPVAETRAKHGRRTFRSFTVRPHSCAATSQHTQRRPSSDSTSDDRQRAS